MRTNVLRLLIVSFIINVIAHPILARPLIESNSRFSPQQTSQAMVICGEQNAAQIGSDIMRKGGNAIDAAVATGLAMAVTLPRAGNIGGGGFLLYHTPEGQVYSLDFRETAPSAAHPKLYYKDDQPQTGWSKSGGLASGIPGTVAGFYSAHSRFGKLPWPEVVQPSINLARNGFVVSRWLEEGLHETRKRFALYPSSQKVFLPQGTAPQAGTIWTQPELAATLEQIALKGPAGFYQGPVAQEMVDSIQAAGGIWTLEDLAHYKAVWRKPLSTDFQGYRIHTMPAPSSGGIHLIQMLNMVEYCLQGSESIKQAFSSLSHNSAHYIHWLSESMRTAYADRSKWLGDPDFFPVPTEFLTSKEYAQDCVNAILEQKNYTARESKTVSPVDIPYESHETTHYATVDSEHGAVSVTYTLNYSYGSGFVAGNTGVLLNNEMDDFAIAPGVPNAFGLVGDIANQVESQKRPLSSMTPTIITQNGELRMLIGAAGGSRIITSVFESILNVLVHKMNILEAVTLPRFHHQWLPDTIFFEKDLCLDTAARLETFGHRVTWSQSQLAHVQGIYIDQQGCYGGQDPRRPSFVSGY